MNWSSKWADNPTIIGIDLASGPDKTILTFVDGNKRRSIDVIIVGDLALDYDNDGWNIYHVPTLARFTKAVPSRMDDCPEEELYAYEPSDLLNWMKTVQENYPTAWQMLRQLTPETYESKGDSAKKIIKEWCLSVKVE